MKPAHIRQSIESAIVYLDKHPEKSRTIVEGADLHSPVSDTLQRDVPKTVEAEAN